MYPARNDEFSGCIRLRDHAENCDVFAGIRIWVEPGEVGISMNDGRGGPAESITFTNPWACFVIVQMLGLLRRQCFRYSPRQILPRPHTLTSTTERAI